jgi:hypothetical protein
VRSALVADVLRGNDRLVVRGEVHGESMLPLLWPGDVVEIESCSLQDVRPGEILLAQRDDLLVLHRLVAAPSSIGFLLRGDSVAVSDPPFPPTALLGRLVRKAGGRGALNPQPRFSAKCFRALGMLLRHCSVARRLTLKLHDLLRTFRSSKAVGDATSAEFPA